MNSNKNKIICKCQQAGIEVGFDTVFNLTNHYIRNTLNDDKFYLCINKDCNIAYYSENEMYINLDQVIKPVWFKNQEEQFVVCYCRDISIEDIAYAINNLSEPITVEKVVHFLQKEHIQLSCLMNNPTGMSCERLFNSAINYLIKNIKEGEKK